MTRIPPVEPPYDDEVTATFERLMPSGMDPLMLFRTVAHNPRVLKRMQRGGLLDPGSITVRQRELVILRTCALNGAEYEWSVHAAIFGAQAGLDEAALEATLSEPKDAAWSDDERAILALCDQLHDAGTIDDALFQRLRDGFTNAQIIELTMLAGLYHAVSFVVNVAGLEPESWTPRWSREEATPDDLNQ